MCSLWQPWGPPGGGRTFITDRYLRHYNLIALSQVTFADEACTATKYHTTCWPLAKVITLLIHALCHGTAAHHSYITQSSMMLPSAAYLVVYWHIYIYITYYVDRVCDSFCTSGDQ